MIVKKIFEGVFDDEVHIAFLKFGRGNYKDKYLIEGKKQAKKWSVKTGNEYANFLVRWHLGLLKDKSRLTGVIVSTLDLKDEINFDLKKVSNFQGVRKYAIDSDIDPKDILKLMDKYPKAFFALSFKNSDFDLKIKAKAPTSGKPGKEKEDGPVADFCSLKTSDKALINELFFDIVNFEKVNISHEIDVEEILYPKDMSNMKPAEIREYAKRKGVLKRIAVVDGEERTSQAEFVA